VTKKSFYPLLFVLFSTLAACAHTPSGTGDSQRGVASWYGKSHHGHRTASGEAFNMNDLTAAHPSLPMNSIVRVKSLSSGQTVQVRINDRGPFSGGRIIDLSYEAAKRLGMIQKGMDQVELQVLSVPVPN
jgi:rare lipoprotein A